MGTPNSKASQGQGPEAPCGLMGRWLGRPHGGSCQGRPAFAQAEKSNGPLEGAGDTELAPMLYTAPQPQRPAEVACRWWFLRRVGTQAARNRIKRVFREAFRLERADWRSDWDVVVYVRSAPQRQLTLKEAQDLLRSAVAAFGRKPRQKSKDS